MAESRLSACRNTLRQEKLSHAAGLGERPGRTRVNSLGSSIEPSPLNHLPAKLRHSDANPVKRLRIERKTPSGLQFAAPIPCRVETGHLSFDRMGMDGTFGQPGG